MTLAKNYLGSAPMLRVEPVVAPTVCPGSDTRKCWTKVSRQFGVNLKPNHRRPRWTFRILKKSIKYGLKRRALTKRESRGKPVMNSKICSSNSLYPISPDSKRMDRKLGYDDTVQARTTTRLGSSSPPDRPWWISFRGAKLDFRTTTPAAPLVDGCSRK